MGKITTNEIPWLSLSARVLKETSDSAVPPIERLKFRGLFSSDLDESYRVCVATPRRLLDRNLGNRIRSAALGKKRSAPNWPSGNADAMEICL